MSEKERVREISKADTCESRALNRFIINTLNLIGLRKFNYSRELIELT